MEVKINLNDEVKVKLTDFGMQILKQRHDELNNMIKASGGRGTEFVLRIDEDGYYKTQLHNLMYIFGEYTSIGAKGLPFETNMIIKDC